MDFDINTNRFSGFKLLLILIFFDGLFLNAQFVKQYKILHLNAKISINPYQKEVTGIANYKIIMLKDADSIMFDSQGINTRKVQTGCFRSHFRQTNKLLIINKKFKKNKIYKIHIHYRSKPKLAMYFTGWNKGGREQVWTQGQGKDNSHWLPTDSNRNDKFTWQLSINFPKDYRVISNGIFISKQDKIDGTATTVFAQPQPAPAYLIFIGAGKYTEQVIITSNHIQVYNYQYTDRLKNDKTYYKTKEIFDAVEQEIGVPYPWLNYKQIPCRDFLFGGMENVSATSFNGDRYVIDSLDFNDINFINVSAHEMTHQWFGDLVTGKTDYDHWLHEAFATYYARLIDSRIFGKDYTAYKTFLFDRQIIANQKNDTIPLHRPNASSLTYYRKGAKIIEMLRQKLGDENYRKLIKTYFKRFAYKNASTSDFKKLLYDVTGDSLPQFFNIWYEDFRIPRFDLIQRNDSIVINKNSHNLPLDFLVLTDSNQYFLQQANSFKLPDNSAIIKTVIANPGNKKLYDVHFSKPDLWLKNQILSAPDFIDRYKALTQIRNWDFKQKDVVFQQLINRQEYFPIYMEILKQIKTDLNDETHLQMLARLFKKDLKTRQQIAIELDSIPISLKDQYKSLLDDASYFTKQSTLWHYWIQFPAERNEILDKTRNIQGGNDKAFRMVWLSLALLTGTYKPFNNQEFINELIGYSAPRYNMQIRLKSIDMIIQMRLVNAEFIDNLIDAAFHFNWRLHKPARENLKKLYQIPEYKYLINMKLNNLPDEQKSFLEKYLKN